MVLGLSHCSGNWIPLSSACSIKADTEQATVTAAEMSSLYAQHNPTAGHAFVQDMTEGHHTGDDADLYESCFSCREQSCRLVNETYL